MARDRLRIVLRLREMEVDDARTELVRRETRVHAAAVAAHEAEAAIQSEMTAAARLSADDAAVEAFGAWLPSGRRAVLEAQAVLSRAQGESAQARARLNVARAAAEAVKTLIADRDAEASREVLRREQIDLDEAGARAGPKR